MAAWNAIGHPGKPPLFTPATYFPGSSIHHLDEFNAGMPCATVMVPFASPGQMKRTLTGLDTAVLGDYGYRITRSCTADIDASGAVGFGDLLAVLALWPFCLYLSLLRNLITMQLQRLY